VFQRGLGIRVTQVRLDILASRQLSHIRRARAPEHLVRDAEDFRLLAGFFQDAEKEIVGIDHGAPCGGKDEGVRGGFLGGRPPPLKFGIDGNRNPALRFHYRLPIVRNSLTWMLDRMECPSAYSLAWVILAAAAYKDVWADVLPVIDIARNRLAALVEDPKAIEDTSTISLAALALGPEGANNPFEVKV
jgi:hypothetical protein